MRQREIVVAHSLKRWLPQTEVWQFSQIASLPSEIRNCIVCGFLENTEQFPLFCNSDIRCSDRIGRVSSDNGMLMNILENIDKIGRTNDNAYGGSSSSSRLRIKPKFSNTAKKWRQRYQDNTYRKFLFEQIKDSGTRILHSHFGNRGWLNIGVAQKAQVKHVVSFYGMDVGYLPAGDSRWRDRYRELFYSADLVLAEGPGMADRIKQIGCSDEKLRIHHLGVMLDRLPFRPRQKRKSDPLGVLIAASFREKKGITYAVVALKRLDRVGPVVITIAGDDDGSLQSLREKQKILKAIDGLSGKVRLTGFLTHEELLVEAYRHHVFLSPSVVSADGDIEGGAPVTIIEMAATGMMVVSTRHCDIPYVIKDGETGFLANERDVDGLVEHLHWLNDNPESWEKVAIAARTHIERDFNARDQGMRLAAVYKSLSR